MNATREGLHNYQGEQGKASPGKGGKGACSIRRVDPRNWAPLFPSSDKTVDEFSNFEIMVSEQDFLAENHIHGYGQSWGAILAVDQFELDNVFKESLVLWFRDDLLGVRTNIVTLSHMPL